MQPGPVNSETPAPAREEGCSVPREKSAAKLNEETEPDRFPEEKVVHCDQNMERVGVSERDERK